MEEDGLEVFKRDDEKCSLFWKGALIQTPTKVFLTNDGKYCITLDKWYGTQKDSYAVIIYSEGVLVSKYALEELLGDLEGLRKGAKISQSKSGYQWLKEASLEINDKYFLAVTRYGRKIAFELESGKITNKKIEVSKKNIPPINESNYLEILEQTPLNSKYVALIKKMTNINIYSSYGQHMGHMLSNHPDKTIRFGVSGDYNVKEYVIKIRMELSVNNKIISCKFDPVSFETNSKIAVERFDEIKSKHKGLEIDFLSDSGVGFKRNVAGNTFSVSVGYYIGNGEMKWQNYSAEDFMKFTNHIIKNNFYNLGDDDYFSKVKNHCIDTGSNGLDLSIKGKTVIYNTKTEDVDIK